MRDLIARLGKISAGPHPAMASPFRERRGNFTSLSQKIERDFFQEIAFQKVTSLYSEFQRATGSEDKRNALSRPANFRESEATSEFIRDDSRQFAGKTLNLIVS